jgi:gliding motility-associated-like protein
MGLLKMSIISLLVIWFFTSQSVYSQNYSSKDNYTGSWESPSSWDPVWTNPTTLIDGYDLTIYGYVTVNGPLSFSKLPSHLIINDTLVINGDLNLGDLCKLTINSNGILIVKGGLTFGFSAEIEVSNYLIVTGDIFKLGSNNEGSFNGTTDPLKIFIGGRIYPTSIQANPLFPALNCPAQSVSPYEYSTCSFGNMKDIVNDPIYTFFQSVSSVKFPAIIPSGPLTFCSGGSVILTASEGTAYLWSTGATTQSITVYTSGSYAVEIYYADVNLSAKSATIAVTVNDLPGTPVITPDGPLAFCAGGNVTLTSTQGAGYLWSTGDTRQKIKVSSGGNYSVRVVDLNGCVSLPSGEVPVTVNALPEVNAGADKTIPNGTSTTLDATVTGTGPFTFSWSPAAQLVNPLTEDPSTVNLLSTTVFTLTAVSALTTCHNSDAVQVNITGGALSASPAATPVTVCAGASVQLDAIASGGSGTYTYSWTSVPVGFTSSSASPTADPLQTTTYNIAVSDGFTTVNSQITVNVNTAPPAPLITAGGPLDFCFGGSVRLTSTAGSDYLWSDGETTRSIDVSTSGTYTVRISNSSGCFSSDSPPAVVTMNPLPPAPGIDADGPMTFCEGGRVTLTSSPAEGYLWSDSESSQSLIVSSTGTFTVRITDSNGCQSPASSAVMVEVIPLPLVAISGSSNTMCLTEKMILTATPSGGTFVISDGPGALSENILSATGPGSITIEYIYTDKCTAIGTISVNVIGCANEIPSVITPNNDGKNDYFKTGEYDGKVELFIFNRWGIKEYTNLNYLNDWDGRNDKGNGLPQDTYFYILKYDNGEIKKGSVLIKR